jgi:hypothetical protein
LPLAHPSDLSQEAIARRVFAMAEGLIGETVRILAEAAVLAVRDGVERITPRSLDALDYTPLSERRRSALLRELL